MAVLKCDTLYWQLRNACPACTYKLEGEGSLIFSLLVTLDGNDSLKRVLRKENDVIQVDGETHIPGKSKELQDRWEDYLHEELQNAIPGSDYVDDNPCATCWMNMINDMTSRMWSVFDETGIFLALCRHGFVLLVADMVRSGELSKYPLVMVEVLLNIFGKDIGCGYDIRCKFGTTIQCTAPAEKATKENFQTVVGLFHGYVHKCLCQLKFLPTYITGIGLEDLEGSQYLKHIDKFDTSHNLSMFLVNNYYQALEIIANEPALQKGMKDENIADIQVFHDWLKEECGYLVRLATEPQEEMLQMDYYQKLVNLQQRQEELDEIEKGWQIATTDPNSPEAKAKEKSYRSQHRHAINNHNKAQAAVNFLEETIPVHTTWTPDMEEYQHAQLLVSKWRYQRALDELEGLIVSCIFELTKMNMSQTGYKLHKHIAKALQSRSQTIKTAINHYNTAAQAMKLPCPTLSYDKVIDYTFLSEFNILHDS
ncbi:hypothetical protein AN958_02172 [Leucoagaricus sp. SymC.cos]|nr:hypothetical protein AN958_02172 [Leucoagaricus sp. SymC.cos]